VPTTSTGRAEWWQQAGPNGAAGGDVGDRVRETFLDRVRLRLEVAITGFRVSLAAGGRARQIWSGGLMQVLGLRGFAADC